MKISIKRIIYRLYIQAEMKDCSSIPTCLDNNCIAFFNYRISSFNVPWKLKETRLNILWIIL
ncbi:hypothetical protein BpHYR1_032797 [Brachionus plicatilis]|uniref:Uncharacterized protein n=1 Tax=Brachionus plicatilis TaxID=10195 RepID=A0A3M7ST68_BRAPC|nr:hypothetical protein BpHYR1_032797 [Brachionus plicatilis]